MKTDSISLTHPQKRIFLQTRREPDSSWPVDLYLCKYTEAIDFELLSQALNIYAGENEGLRVKLLVDNRGGAVDQCFVPHARREWKKLDFSNSSDAKYEQWKSIEKQRKFNIFKDILYDFHLVTFPDSKQGFSMTMHHICSDGHTRITAAERVTEIYQDIVHKRPVSENPSAPYREFAVYEQAYLESAEFDRDRDFWMSENLHELVEYKLAHERVWGDVPNRCGVCEREIPENLLQSMERLSRNEGLSLFTQFLTALAVLIHRITDLDAFAVSFFGHNRTREDMKTTAGMFTGTYPLRVDVINHPSFLELATTISNKVRKIVKVHGMFPFDELVKMVREKHEADINHLINMSILYLCYPNSPHFELRHEMNAESQNELTMSIEKYDNPEVNSKIVFLFDTRIYQETDIQKFCDSIMNILQKALLYPSIKVGDLPLIFPDQYEQLIHKFSGSSKDFPERKCLHHLFEEAALKNQSNTAIECGGKTISFGELNLQADLLAEKLRHVGIGPESRVGICMDKSIEMVVSFLAVLKAGGAYVPIDPGLPPGRIRFILHDTSPACLIVHQCYADVVPQDGTEKLIRYHDGSFLVDFRGETSDGAAVRATPNNLMYVIYTSGSTGNPKGVMVEHHSFVNMIEDQIKRYKLTGKDRFLHYMSFSFDASQEHLYRTLCSGSVLCMTDPQRNPEEADIRESLKRFRITCCSFTASLLETLEESDFPDLKALSSGADTCSMTLVKKWSRDRRFFNSYGPTEATVLSTISQLDAGVEEAHIGRPIANVQVYVLDRYRKPLPIGTRGELYIGGEGVARGYLNQPELTEKAFVPNPFDETEGSRLYRTGDIVYFREDGNLVFVGRRDTQCKIRGFRVEPGETREAILQHPAVKDAAVVVHKFKGRQQLAAFYVVAAKKPLDDGMLKTYLNEKLPFYMVPERLVCVDSIPLTTRGKVDQNELLQLLVRRPDVQEMEVAQSETEQSLKEIWCDILNVQDISITENFFFSGGDSLMALEICVAIEKYFQINISLQQFMESPTIKSIAARLDRKKRESETIVRIKNSETGTGSLAVIHEYTGTCNYGHLIGRELDNTLDVYVLTMDETTLSNLKVESIQDLAVFQVEQLLKQDPPLPLLLCGYSWSGILAFEMAVELEKRKIPVELLMIDTKFPGISDCSIGEKIKHGIFQSFRALFYLVNPILLVMKSITTAGRRGFRSSMDETFLELQSYFSTIRHFVRKGNMGPPVGKQSVTKTLRLLPIHLSPGRSSVKAHFLMTRPDSFIGKMLPTDHSERWGRRFSTPMSFHRLYGEHKMLFKKNLSSTTDCIQEIIYGKD